MRYYVIFFFTITGISAASGCGSTTDKSFPIKQKPSRIFAGDHFKSVGVIAKGNNIICSGIAMKQGVFFTAKHCFPNTTNTITDTTDYSLRFSASGILDENQYIIPGGRINQILFEGQNSDIAFVIFSPEANDDLIFSDEYKISNTSNLEAQELKVVGYPQRNDPYDSIKRIISTDCYVGIRQGEVFGYDGDLVDTTCPAYWGSSGGPVFSVIDDELVLIGVITHTFDLNQDGTIDRAKMIDDQFGTYTTGNFSPFSRVELLNTVMKTEY